MTTYYLSGVYPLTAKLRPGTLYVDRDRRNSLSTVPVQAGQKPFELRDGETIAIAV